jgi:hypothetical protein
MSVQSGGMLLDMPLLQMRPLAELTAHGFERIAHGDMRIGVRGVSSWRACGDLFVPLELDGDSDMKVLALARTLVLVTFSRRHTATVDARIKRSQLPQLFDPGRTATYGCPIFSSPPACADCRLPIAGVMCAPSPTRTRWTRSMSVWVGAHAHVQYL